MLQLQRHAAATKTARRYRLAVALRVLTPSVVLALIAAAATIALIVPKENLVAPTNWAAQPSFAQVDAKELAGVFNSSMAVMRQSHLRRTELESTLKWLDEGYFDNIRTQADLKQALKQLVIESKDPYAAVLTNEEYRHLVAREGGATIGIKLKLSHESKVNAWVVQEVPKGSSAELEGVEKGDIVASIDGLDGSTFKSSTNIDTLFAAGFLGSRVPMSFRRGTNIFEVELAREVTSVASPTSLHTGHSEMGAMTGVRVLDINNLQHPDVIKDVIVHLKELASNEKEENVGLILDLNNAGIATAETAARLSALFIDKGVICHYIRTTGDRQLEICRYEVRASDGKVVHVVKGPYQVAADGKIDAKSKVEERQEVLDWPSGMYKQYLVVVVGSETTGAGEIVAAAIKANNPRARLVAQFLTAGKGMSQTYFPAGPDLMVRLTTGFYMQPDGRDIEGARIRPHIGISSNADLDEAAMEEMGTLLSKVPKPELPDKSR